MHAKRLKCLQRTKEMRYTPGKMVELPHDHGIKASPMGFGHQPIQLRPLFFGATDAQVNELTGDTPAPALAILTQLPRLHRGILAIVRGADTGIDCDSHSSPRRDTNAANC